MQGRAKPVSLSTTTCSSKGHRTKCQVLSRFCSPGCLQRAGTRPGHPLFHAATATLVALFKRGCVLCFNRHLFLCRERWRSIHASAFVMCRRFFIQTREATATATGSGPCAVATCLVKLVSEVVHPGLTSSTQQGVPSRSRFRPRVCHSQRSPICAKLIRCRSTLKCISVFPRQAGTGLTVSPRARSTWYLSTATAAALAGGGGRGGSCWPVVGVNEGRAKTGICGLCARVFVWYC